MEAVAVAFITTGGAVLVAWLNLNKKHKASMGVLGEINAAVNNKAPGEPTLRSVAMETYQALGRVEGKLDVHIGDRSAHKG